MLGFVFNRRALLKDPKRLGRWGEIKSERFLRRKGLRTLARNFNCKTGEIDLVMAEPRDGTIVFVEVKTRTSEEYFAAEAAVTAAKRRCVVSAAKYFAIRNKVEGRPRRFDVVAVVLGKKGEPEIRHFEYAVVP
ncbi:MAG: YraN family protein [Planctomycetes bacterium GWF2_50_10]|nr:MAG: YraN family protein [Planctomycetes bacterium GWF2_50_10]